MRPTPKIIKSSKFEDGTYAIKAPVHPLPLIEQEAGGAPIDPARAEAEAHSRELLERAREEATAMLADAEARLAERERELLERVEAERQQALEAARREGFARGVAEGQRSGEQAVLDRYADALDRLHRGIEEAASERNLWFEAQQKDLVKLALLIAQKILVLELATSRDAAVEMAKAAIAHVTDKTHVRLRVHPLDLPRLNAARPEVTLAVDNLTSLEIVGDPAIGLGGCMVDTRTGMVDARLSTQLAEIAAALLDIAPGPDGAEDLDPVVLAAVRALGQGGHVLTAAPQPQPTWQRPTPAPETLAAPAVKSGQAAALAAAMGASAEPARPMAPQAEEAAPVETVIADALPAPEPLWSAPEPEEDAQAVVPAWTPLEPEVVLPAPAEPPVLEAQVAKPAPAAPSATPAPDPAPVQSPAAPQAAAAPPRGMDPSRRAADALAARLGLRKKGKGVATLAEEYDMTQLEGALTDAELEAIVRSTTRNAPASEIGTDTVLVHNPYALEDAADELAERLGKKKKPRGPWHGEVETDEASRDKLADALGSALDDRKIDEIMGNILPRVPADEPAEEAPAAPDIDRASENLAKLLGKSKKKSNRPWYEQ